MLFCHVHECACQADGGVARGRARLGRSEAKVGELGDALEGEEDVLRLDVAVHKRGAVEVPAAVEVGQRARDLQDDGAPRQCFLAGPAHNRTDVHSCGALAKGTAASHRMKPNQLQ